MSHTTQEITFSPSQDKGVNKMQEWLKKPASKKISDRVFLLTGKAGTGKTTIIKHALKDLIDDDIANTFKDDFGGFMSGFGTPNCSGVAMSHKAKNVLKTSIPNVYTYASYFGLKIKYLQNGAIDFVKEKYKEHESLPCEMPIKVVVHDEISMYDINMLNTVLDETHPYTKIILMGDSGQLPPVNSDGVDLDSPAFYLPLDESSRHHLEERVRQTEGNPIIEMSDVIYDEIFGSQDIMKVLKVFNKTKMENDIGYHSLNYREFLSDYKNASELYLDTKVIAYKNTQVDIFNNSIRKYVHNNPEEMFIPTEIIYMNDSYTHMAKGEKNKKPRWICYNSDEYLIKSIAFDKLKGIHCYSVFIETKGHTHLPQNKEVFIRLVSEQGEAEYKKQSYFRKNAALTADYNEKGKKWRYYYELVNLFGNVSYGYCFTGYKAQGSTYKNVYIDVNDIITTGPITTKRKLQALYTAVTRASHKVTLLKSK